MRKSHGRNPNLYQPRSTDGRPFCVYRIYDSNEYLLYVGASRRVSDRLREHSKSKQWWHEVDQSKITTTWYGCVTDASDAEESAIRSERPKYNVGGKDIATNGYRNSRGRERGCYGDCVHAGKPTLREVRMNMTTTLARHDNITTTTLGGIMIEMRLLELQAEFADFGSNAATLDSLGLQQHRTRDQIAREYGITFRAFLATEPADPMPTDDDLADAGMYRCRCGDAVYPLGDPAGHCEMDSSQ